MDAVLKFDHTQLVALVAAVLPGPIPSRITSIMEQERQANPHNDSYKLKRWSDQDISAQLRVEEAISVVYEAEAIVSRAKKASALPNCDAIGSMR